MIKVYKDVLDKIGIQNIFLTGENNAFCTILEIDKEGKEWVISTDKEFYTDNIIMNIKINDTYIEIKSEIEKLENGLYKVIVGNCKKKQFLQIIDKIKELEKHHELWEKRKEERFNIGIDNSDNFFLSKPEQEIVFNKQTLPCLVNNVSFSGANITTVFLADNEFKRGNEIHLVLKFNKPIEQIALKGTIQSVAVKSAKNSNRIKFAIIAMELINPALSYKERITQFIKNKEV